MQRNSGQSRQAGLSVVELMVGIAVGLFLVAGAIKMFTDYLGSNRRLLVETRLNQDLRAAADMVARDLRRAGYWRNSTTGIWTVGVPTVTPNPYVNVSASNSTVVLGNATYAYDKDGTDLYGGVATPSPAESFGYDVSDGVLRYTSSGVAQSLTDRAALRVTEFRITPRETTSELYTSCPCNVIYVPGSSPPVNTCPANLATHPNRVRLVVRQYDIALTAEAANDNTVRRSLVETVRVRNDALIGTYCP